MVSFLYPYPYSISIEILKIINYKSRQEVRFFQIQKMIEDGKKDHDDDDDDYDDDDDEEEEEEEIIIENNAKTVKFTSTSSNVSSSIKRDLKTRESSNDKKKLKLARENLIKATKFRDCFHGKESPKLKVSESVIEKKTFSSTHKPHWCWDHFKTIKEHNTYAACNLCVDRALDLNDDGSIMWNINYGKDRSPSLLERHLYRYHPEVSHRNKQKIADAQVTQKNITVYSTKSKYDNNFKESVLEYVIMCNQPFSIVANEHLLWKEVRRKCMLILDENANAGVALPGNNAPPALVNTVRPAWLEDDENDGVIGAVTNNNNYTRVNIEVNAFRNEPKLDIAKTLDPHDNNKVLEYHNPLEWWKEKQILYPTIAKLARRILCQPATSAPSERLFNIAGLTIANDRASILPDNAQDVIFLRDNWNLIKEWFSAHNL
jgi:hypothetical protein